MIALSPEQIGRLALVVDHVAWMKKQLAVGEISAATLKRSIQWWDLIDAEADQRISVPDACVGPDGEMFFSWDAGRHHLSLELIPDNPAEWFYRDRETGEIWGEDQDDSEAIPSKVLELMPLFFVLPH